MNKHRYEQAYSAIRLEALRVVESQILSGDNGSREIWKNVKFSPISRDVIHKFRESWLISPNRIPPWDWDFMWEDFKKYPDRFEISISFQDILCGLAIGKPSGAKKILSVYYMEGNPDPQHPLRGLIIPLVLDAAMFYAQALGSRHLHLIEPIPSLIPKYQQLGFTLETPAKGSQYCWKEIGL